MNYYQCEKCAYVPLPSRNCPVCGGDGTMVCKTTKTNSHDALLKACEEMSQTEGLPSHNKKRAFALTRFEAAVAAEKKRPVKDSRDDKPATV